MRLGFCSVQLAECSRATLVIYCSWQNTFVDNSAELPSGKHIEKGIDLGQTPKGGETAISYITLSFFYMETALARQER